MNNHIQSNIITSPSLLSADPMRFFDEMRDVESAGACMHHIDVMDGHFVPNLTYGLHFIKPFKKHANIPLDVHLMISNPDAFVLRYVEEGADFLSFHIEATNHAYHLVKIIKKAGAKAGIAINPGTALESLEPVLNNVDFVTLMSVSPGFGGQTFIESTLSRIERLRAMLKQIGHDKRVLIAVDGGIDENTSKAVVRAGANILVAGSYIYNSNDRRSRLKKLSSIRVSD